MKKSLLAMATMLAFVATPALADETDPPKEFTVTGSVALVSDYRFRGVSQSDEDAAVQGGFTVTHESGLYAGIWSSNLAGWGTFGGPNLELDLFGGYKRAVGGATVDVGLTWYTYPGGADLTDFAEPYVKVSGTLGPVSALAGVAYAPKQRSLGNFSNTPFSRGQAEDNLYLWGDASVGVPKTPFTVKGHVGYSDGNPGSAPTAPAWRQRAPMSIGCSASMPRSARSCSASLIPIPTSRARDRPICCPTSARPKTAARSPGRRSCSRYRRHSDRSAC